MLDGVSSLDEIAEEFERRFPPQSIRVEELQQFVGTLHRSGLVITDSPGQGDQLKKRRDERRGKELQQKFTNILSIRFKGIDPDWILNALYAIPPVRWFWSKTCFILCIILVSAAALLIGVQFDDFQAKLPDFNTFFAAENWLLMAAVLGCTKVLHEFGHGLSCKHFGGECHEMGVMLLVLTPCLYCNVSDSWMLPNKWHRAAIGAAGMYVEVVLASICTFIWWFTEPGLLHYTCLNIMFVSSVSTILFNANPLLRYDGYYIMSDL
ncbi:MAG: hemolysin D, partial [Planctomycetota bacterium]